MSVEPFHNKLRRLRLGRDMTQDDLAVELGVTAETVKDWERGYRKPNHKSGHLLRRALPALGIVPSPRQHPPARRYKRVDLITHQLAALEAISQEHGVTVRELLRVAVDRYLSSL